MDLYAYFPFPEDIVTSIINFLDIDTRIQLRIPPKKLTKERYEPLKGLAFPIFVNPGWTVLRLRPTTIYIHKIGYVYQRIRRFQAEDAIVETIIPRENPDQPYSHWWSIDLVLWNFQSNLI